MHFEARYREGLNLKDKRPILAVTVHDSDASAAMLARTQYANEHVVQRKQTINVGGLIVDIWINVVRERPNGPRTTSSDLSSAST